MKILVEQAEGELQYKVSSDIATINTGANLNKEQTLRPMELILSGLAACSAIDIEVILQKQKVSYSSLKIEANGKRADSTPAVFESIILNIEVSGEVDQKKIERAIQLTKDKYCSVYKMLYKAVKIEYQYEIVISPFST